MAFKAVRQVFGLVFSAFSAEASGLGSFRHKGLDTRV